MRNAIVISYAVFLLASCASDKNIGLSCLPSCLANKIDSARKDASQNPPTSVIQYSYKGSPVFYIVSGCCDRFNPVYNSNCNYLGAPDGGITGKGDGKLTDFYVMATNKKVIWKSK